MYRPKEQEKSVTSAIHNFTISVNGNNKSAPNIKNIVAVTSKLAAEIFIRNIDNLGNESYALANHFASDNKLSVSERGNFALKHLCKKEV